MKLLLIILCATLGACTSTRTNPDGSIVVTRPDGKTIQIIGGMALEIANAALASEQAKRNAKP